MDPEHRACRRYFLAHDKEEMPIVWPKRADLCRTARPVVLSYSVTVADWEHQDLGTPEA